MMFENVEINRLSVTYNELHLDEHKTIDSQINNLKEDLFQAVYRDKYILDVGWYPEFDRGGEFIIYAIKDFDWEHPRVIKKCRDISRLEECFFEVLDEVDSINNIFCGGST